MRQKTLILQILTISFFLLIGTIAYGAKITLENGEVVVGEIKQENVPFQAKIGNIEIKAKEIVSFKEGKLKLRDGTTISGTFGGVLCTISTNWGGEISVNAKEIMEISSEQKQIPEKQKIKETPYTPSQTITEPLPSRQAKPLIPLKKTIAVISFESKADKANITAGGIDIIRRKSGAQVESVPKDAFDPITRGLADQLTDALVQSGRFRVLDRQIIESVIAEQDLRWSERTTKQGSAAAIGGIYSAQTLVKGAVTEFDPGTAGSGETFNFSGFSLGSTRTEAHVAVIIYLVDTTTSQIIDSQRVEGKAERGGVSWGFSRQDFSFGQSGFKETPLGKATQMVINRAVEYISQRLEKEYWQGKVAKVVDSTIFINAGRSSGVSIGQDFIVCEGTEIVDPATGASLGHSLKPVGLIRVSNIYPDFAEAQLIEGSLPLIKVGHFVVERGAK